MTKNKRKKDKPANRCEKCGFKIGGKNHEEGYHHRNGSSGRTGVMRKY